MKNEVEQIQDALNSKYSIDTIRHATFLVISRTATEQAIKGHGLDEYMALQDHGTVLMAEDLDLDIHAIRRAEVALQQAGVVLSHLEALDAPPARRTDYLATAKKLTLHRLHRLEGTFC